jgi:hypothetical protein
MDTVKTTFNLPTDLLQEAKLHAVKHKTSVTDLVRQGLELRLGRKTEPTQSLVEFVASGPKFAISHSQKERATTYLRHLKEKYG